MHFVREIFVLVDNRFSQPSCSKFCIKHFQKNSDGIHKIRLYLDSWSILGHSGKFLDDSDVREAVKSDLAAKNLYQ